LRAMCACSMQHAACSMLNEFMDEAVKLKNDRRLMADISTGDEKLEDLYIAQESKAVGDFMKLLITSHKHREFLEKRQ
jgi:hypothetical protein